MNALILILLAAAPPYTLGFEDGRAEWTPNQNEAAAADRLTVVEEPVWEGRYALKATVRPGDLVENGARAEVVLSTIQDRAYEGEELWYRWATYFPEDWVFNPYWHVFTQWHQGLDYGMGSPPVAFCIDKYGYLYLTHMSGYYDSLQQWGAGTMWRTPLVKGRWIEFLFHVKWSRSWTEGFIELWVDGVHVVPLTYTANMDSDGLVYLKQGLYRNRATTITQTVYHDGMKIGRTREEVEPPLPVEDAGQPPVVVEEEEPAAPDAGSPPDAGTPAPIQLPSRGCGSGFSLLALLGFIVKRSIG